MNKSKCVAAGLVVLGLVLPPLAFVLYLVLQTRGLLPAGWPEFDLGELRLAWERAGDLIEQAFDASGRAGQTGSPGGVIGGTGGGAAGGATPPKGHIHRSFEEWWDEFDEEHIEPWEETWDDFKEDVGDLWDDVFGDGGGEGSK